MKNKFKILLVAVLLTTILNIDIKEPKEALAFDDVGICDQITANSGHNDRCGEGQITFVNNSFEEPRLGGSFSNINANDMPGWETTNSRNLIELWASSFAVSYTGTGCQDGNQCVEINATEPAALYQDFEVKPGQFVYYSFYHMGRRSGGETLELRIGKPNNESGNKLNPTTGGIDDKVLESTAEKGIWDHRFGIYQVPEDFASDGSTTIRIAFLSTTSSSLGNLIDNIEFYTIAVYDNEISISEPVGGAADPTTDIFSVSNTLKYFDRDVFSTEKSSVTYTLSPDIEYVPGSMVVEGVSHSDVAVNGNEIVVTNLPELHEDIDITYNVKLNSSPNVARLQISSYFEYASNLVVDNYPTSYEMYNVKDTASLNVSYNTEGYCDGITANNGYSDDCGIATNTVYNNDITLTDNNPTSALKDKTFTITNDLKNLNLDKDLDETTSTVVYDYTNNMKIDFSTLKINDVLHSDYTNTQGPGGAKFTLNNLPDYGIEDYKITFNATYDFSAPATRDIFVREFLIASTLNYKNDSGDSYVSDKDQMNLSYATTMNITGTLTDDSSNNLLAPGEGLSGKATVTNSSPIVVNNVVVNLITDTAKLNATLTDVIVKRGSDVLVLDTDYTINGSRITFLKFAAAEEITIDYTLSTKTDFTNSNELRNTISVVSDEYTDGKYFLQRMNIDILAGTKVEVTSSVTDNKNDVAGNNEELTYTLQIKNVGSFDVKNIEINNLINSSLLKTTGVTVTAKDNNSANISSSLIQYTNNNLVVNKAFSKNETIEITVKASTVAVVSGTTLDNVFNVIAVATNNTKDPVVSSTASIPVSQRPVITVDNFVVINVGDSFNLSSYASATDNEDSDISNKMLYSPAIDSSKPTVQQISVTVVDSDNRSDTKNMVVVVDDGNFRYGDTKIIYAKNFERFISQVSTSDAAIKEVSSLTVLNKSDGKVTGEAVTMEKGGYKAEAGQYNMTFTVNSEPTTKREIVATVKSTNPPVIKGADFVEINVGDSFDPIANVTVSDDFDGNITSKLEVTGTYDVNVPGVYKLAYSVTDADKNTTTETRVLLVNDGNYKAGDVYILYAENFERRVGEVQVQEEAVRVAANAKVFEKKTGNRVTKKKDVALNSYNAVVGDYPITITVADDANATRDIIGSVVTGDIPVLTVPDFKQIDVGGTFNPRTGISATDTEDIDLYSYINIYNPVNVNKAGLYVVEYDVTDNDFNTVNAKQIVLVNDGNYKVGDSRIIYAKDFYILTTDVDTNDTAVIAKAEAKVYDKTTGQISTDALTVTQNGYSSTEAVYQIEFSVSTDASVKNTINADVSSGHDPVITARSFAEVPLNSTFDPNYELSASDIEDGDLTSAITTSNPVDTTIAGIYKVVYEVTDSTGNTVNFTTIVLVNDGRYFAGLTQIIYAKNFTKLISQVETTDTAVITAASAELFSKTTGDSLGKNLSVNIGTYTNVKGQYNITFTSPTELTTKRTIKATVSEGESPILEVEPFIEVDKDDDFYPLNYVTATDGEEGLITPLVDYEGEVDTTTPGFYFVEYNIMDSDGNEDTATTTVLVNDGTYGVGDFYVIQAEGFTKRVGQVSLDIQTVNKDADVIVYDKFSGEVKTAANSKNTTEKNFDYVTNVNDYTAAVGTYGIDFTVRLDPKATIRATAEVESGFDPVIDGDKVTEVQINGTFDRTSGITAMDEEDGDVSAYGRIDGFVNTKVAGIYTLLYYVTDSDGNYGEFTRYVVVNDGTFVVTEKYVVRARDFTLRVGQVDTSSTAVDNETDFAIYDISTEAETSLPYTVNVGDYTADVGEYEIDYLIYDGEEIIKSTVIAEVISGNEPKITTEQYVEIEIGDTFDATAGVVATDIEDKDITSKIEIAGEVDTQKHGVYPITYSVTDSDDNTTTFIKVVVVGVYEHSVGDYVIISADDFEKYVSEVAEPANRNSQIINESNFQVYSKETGEKLTSVKLPTITTSYTNVEGEYDIKFTMDIDPAVEHNVVGTVLAGEEPVFTADPVVVLETGSTFSISDNVKVDDIEDGDITSLVTVSPTVDTSVVGVTKVTYTVTDKDNNTVTFDQVIVVGSDEHTVGESVIIYAVGFEKYVSEVVPQAIRETQIINESGFKVYDATTGEVIENVVPNITSTYTNVEGTYPTTFKVSIDPTISHEIDAVVLAGEEPVFTADDVAVLETGSTFTISDNVNVDDLEDGDITSLVTVSPAIDTSVVGVTKVTYTVTDKDNNTVTYDQVIVIGTEEHTVGDSVIIYAVGFEKYVSEVAEVAERETQILSESGFKAYSKETGEPIIVKVPTITTSYTNEAGTYPITFNLEIEPTISHTVDAVVLAGEEPEFSAEPVIVLETGSTFTISDNVLVDDIEDGDITNLVTVSPTIDTSVVGVTKVTYSVTDSDNNTVTYDQVIVVGSDEHTVGDSVIIYAIDFEKYVSEVATDKTTQIINESGFKVYDVTTGEIIENVIPTVTSTYTNEAGTYPTTFKVTIDPSIEHIIDAVVIAGNDPVFTAEPVIVLETGSTFNINDNVLVDDAEDGDITNLVTVSPTIDTSVVGVTKVTYTVTDSDNNTVTYDQIIVVGSDEHTVGDSVIIYAIDFEKNVSEVVADKTTQIINESGFKVYDLLTGAIIEGVNPTITSSYTNEVGIYPVTFKLDIDPTIEHMIDATVISGNKPEITGDDVVFIEVDSGFNIDDLIDAIDVEDGNIISNVEVSSTIDTSSHGVYVITYTVVDSDNNSATFTQVIVVDDGNYSINGDYIVYKVDYEVNVVDVDTSDEAIIEKSQFAAYTLDGERVDAENISINKNGYIAKAGDYVVIFTINGNDLDSTDVGVNIKVIDKKGLGDTGLVNYYIYTLLLILGLILIRKTYIRKFK